MRLKGFEAWLRYSVSYQTCCRWCVTDWSCITV